MTQHDLPEPMAAAGPAKPRDERAIRHKMSAAITEADDLLRDLAPAQQTDAWRAEIRRVRGLLAEWCVETD